MVQGAPVVGGSHVGSLMPRDLQRVWLGPWGAATVPRDTRGAREHPGPVNVNQWAPHGVPTPHYRIRDVHAGTVEKLMVTVEK